MNEKLRATTNFVKRETFSFEQLDAKAAKVGKAKTTRTTIDLPVEMHTSVKIKAATQSRSIREYIIRLIEKDIYGS